VPAKSVPAKSAPAKSAPAKSTPAKSAPATGAPGKRAVAPVEDGFDPGDEPMDDAVEPGGVRRTSEEQAIALLTEKFGAERIPDGA
jgi:DNA polymerase-3 subunit gamma/tau